MDRFLGFLGSFFSVILFILLFVLLLLALICISHPKIILKYKDKPEISAKLFFIRFNITKFLSRPKKQKPPKAAHFDGTLFGEFPEKEKKKKKKKDSAESKAYGIESTTGHKHGSKKTKEVPEENEKKPLTETVSEYLEKITDILESIREPAKKIIAIDIKKLYVTAASEDAHKTAVLFGHMNTAMGALIYVCRKFASLRINEEQTGVYSNFCVTKPELDAHIVFTLSIRHTLICAFKAIMRWIKK